MDEEPDLAEILLTPCQPSELPRRDAALSARAGGADEIGGLKGAVAALGMGASQAPETSVRDRLLASLTRPGRFGRYADRLARMFDLPIVEAEQLAARIGDPAAYSPFLFEGIEMLEVKAGPRYEGAIAVIAKLQPGARFPDHVHRGQETMFVLAGGFREEGPQGQETWRGDELVSGDGSKHAFVALEGEPCITASLVEGFVEL
jgi:quercetin dioxygenase-like cupin family protein